MANFTIKSTVFVNGTSFAKATISASRLSSISAALGKDGNKELEAITKRLAKNLYDAIEFGVANTMGARKIKETGGRGLKVDLININFDDSTAYTTEVKGSLIRAIKKQADLTIPTRSGSISLGSAIQIGAKGAKGLTVGYSIYDGAVKEEVVSDFTDAENFAKFYAKDNELFKQHLLNPSSQPDENFKKILNAVSKNLQTKAQSLSIPFALNYRQTAVTTIQFTREYILKNAKSVFNAKTNNLEITFAYPQSIINDALKEAAKSKQIQEGYKLYNTNFEKFITNKINSISNNPNSIAYFNALINSLNASMKNQPSVSFDLEYIKGSVVAYKSKINIIRTKTYQPVQGPSLIDITAAVRGRARLRMRRGVGTPKPPKIYERTGAFRSSIQAIANMRANTIEYFYEPYYQSLEQYGYEITELVEGSIRSIAQTQFNKRFNLTRRNT